MNNEEIIAALAELKEIVQASHRQLNGRMSSIENRIAELSGSTAVVLSRSDDNKKELSEHKKKLATWRTTVLNSIEESQYWKKQKYISLLRRKLESLESNG